MFKLSLILATAGLLRAEVKLPAILSDHMVLQRGAPVRVWGAASPGESVRVDFQGQSVSVKAGANGKWSAWLRPLTAAGPLEMRINDLILHDVLVGEVWLGSGQSNMEFRLQTAVNHDEEIAHSDYPMIHLFQVKRAVADQPAEDVAGSWQVCSPASVKTFSAVEYLLRPPSDAEPSRADGTHRERLGRDPAQSWTSKEALAATPR